MATQQEELRLTITLVDDASAGLARIGAQWRQLSSGSTASHIESFRRRQSEIGEQMKQLANAATGGERAMLGFVGKLGIAGFAFAKVTELVGSGLKSLSEFSDSMVDLGNKAKAMGVAPGVLKTIEEQFVRIGGTIAGADQNVARFSEAYAEMGRVGSERRAELIRNAGTYGRDMEAGIDRVLRQRGTVAQINEVLAQGQNVYNNRLRDTHGNVADATKILRDYLATWGIDPTFAQIEHIREASKEEEELAKQRLKNTTEFHKQMADLHYEWNEWMAAIGDSMTGIVTPALQTIVKLIKEARGAGAIELPRTGEPEDIVGKYGGGGGGAPSGAGAPLPLLTEQGSPRESEDYFKTLKENTRELKKLNDKLGPAGVAPSGVGGGIGGGVGGGGIGGGIGGGGTPGAAGGGGGTPSTGGGGATPGVAGGGAGRTPGAARGGGGTPAGIGGGATPRGGGGGGATRGGGGGGATDAAIPGGIAGTPQYNYFQKHGVPGPFPSSQLTTVKTAYGPINVHPDAAADFAGFYGDLAKLGAPIKKLGSYNPRQKRASLGGRGWSSHAYGAATDIDDAAKLSPAMSQWLAEHKDQVDAIKQKWNIGQPLPERDAPHFEWRGPHGSMLSKGGGESEADRPQSADRRAIDPSADRRAIDAKRRKTVRVEASGKLGVNISPEQGSASGNERKLFKPTEPERQSQMVPAQSGPIGAAP